MNRTVAGEQFSQRRAPFAGRYARPESTVASRTTRAPFRTAIVMLLLGFAAACNAPQDQKADPAAVLDPKIADIRVAAGNRDTFGAERALSDLRSTVEDLRRSNDLSDQKADRILAAADEVERNLALLIAPRPTPTRRPTATQRPRPTQAPSTPSPTPTQPAEPTRQPEPTQTPSNPSNDSQNSGNQGNNGLPGILNQSQ